MAMVMMVRPLLPVAILLCFLATPWLLFYSSHTGLLLKQKKKKFDQLLVISHNNYLDVVFALLQLIEDSVEVVISISKWLPFTVESCVFTYPFPVFNIFPGLTQHSCNME